MRHFIIVLFGVIILAFAPMSMPSVEPPRQVYAMVAFADPIHIRLIALKHSHISMADGDANLAIAAVRNAAAKGLHIRSIGDFNIDKDGHSRWKVWEYSYDLPKLREFISQQMKIDAVQGDTVIVFTIGHGFSSGGIQGLGARSDVMTTIANAAEENQQRTVWWQLSCHACAGLPNINTLPESQQKLFSMMASSTAGEESAAGVQGNIMAKVFMAIATNDPRIDPNQDGIITAQELRDFVNTSVGHRRGDLFFARDMNDPIFGGNTCLARELPVLDRNRPQGFYPRNYIPIPGMR